MKLECNECFTLFEAQTREEMFCSEACKAEFDSRLAQSNKIVDAMLTENKESIRIARFQNNSINAQNLISMIKTVQERDKKDD